MGGSSEDNPDWAVRADPSSEPSAAEPAQREQEMMSWDPESGTRLEDAMQRGIVFVMCLFSLTMGLLIAWEWGFTSWVFQQLFILALALELFPWANRIPGVGYVHHGFQTLLKFYRRNPVFRSPATVGMRFLPFLGWIVMIQERKAMVVVMLVGLPLDLLLHTLSAYVWHLDEWGLASQLGFVKSFAVQVLMTFLFTPYVSLFVLAFRWKDWRQPAQ